MDRRAKEINICYLAASKIPSRTANSVHVMKMCHAYASMGHKVTLVIPDHKEGIEPGVEDVYRFYGVPESFKIVKLRLFRPMKLWYAVVMPLRAMAISRADLFHTRIGWTGWGLVRLFFRSTILEIHEVPEENSLSERCYRSTIRGRALSCVVFITEALKQRLLALTNSTPPYVIAPDGVDRKLAESSLSREDSRANLGLQAIKSPIAVYSGHLYSGRGIEVVLELAARHPDVFFLVVGGREEDIAFWREKTTGSDNIRFEGFVPPQMVFGYLRASDILLMPYAHKVSHAGGGDTAEVCSPMKMFEYMAAERAVLASDLPVLQEVLRPEHNCLISQYEDSEDWSHQMERLKRDADLRIRLGKQAREDVLQYCWEERAANILKSCAT